METPDSFQLDCGCKGVPVMLDGQRTLAFKPCDPDCSSLSELMRIANDEAKPVELTDTCPHTRTRELSTITAGKKVFCVLCNEQVA